MTGKQKLHFIIDAMRARMTSEQFHDYALRLVFYKNLSERMSYYADRCLERHPCPVFDDLDDNSPENREILAVIEKNAMMDLGYYIRPSELFNTVAMRGTWPGAGFLAELTNYLVDINSISVGKVNMTLREGNPGETITVLITGIREHLAVIDSQFPKVA